MTNELAITEPPETMQIELHPAAKTETTTIEAFADRHGLVMEVHERTGVTGKGRYYAHFKHAETRSGEWMLKGTYGNGATPEEAIQDYAKEISGKLLIVDAMLTSRREILVPGLRG